MGWPADGRFRLAQENPCRQYALSCEVADVWGIDVQLFGRLIHARRALPIDNINQFPGVLVQVPLQFALLVDG